MIRCASFAAALFFCCTIAAANAAPKEVHNAHVVAVRPDGSLTLADNGNAVFANIMMPDTDLAESWLAAQVLQQEISFTAEDEDRYGRTPIMSDLQQRMLQEGVAVIYVTTGKIPKEWHMAVAVAQAAKKGIWSKRDYILSPENAANHIGEFRVVEGKITRIYNGKSATYINFGENWHTDFSITVPAKTRRSIKPILDKLGSGDKVQITGMIYQENGPMIRLDRADNLEFR